MSITKEQLDEWSSAMTGMLQIEELEDSIELLEFEGNHYAAGLLRSLLLAENRPSTHNGDGE